jgi:hypothetical protein
MPERTVYKYFTEGYTLSATAAGASANVLYTCPANFNATVKYLRVANNNTSTQKFSIQFYHAEDAAYHYLSNAESLSGSTAINLVDSATFFLHAGDKIVGFSATSPSSFDILISVEEEPAQFTFTGA